MRITNISCDRNKSGDRILRVVISGVTYCMRNAAQRSAKSVRCATVRSRIFVRAVAYRSPPRLIGDRAAWQVKKFQWPWHITMIKYVALTPAAVTLVWTGLLCYGTGNLGNRGGGGRQWEKRNRESVASVHYPGIERHYQLAESDSLPVHRQRCIAGWKPP